MSASCENDGRSVRVRQRGGMDKRRKEISPSCTPPPMVIFAPAPPRTTKCFPTLFSAAHRSASCCPAAVVAQLVRYVRVLVDVQLH